MVHGSTQVHIDPGPGALVFSNWAGLSPQKLDAVVVTHCHPDHYGDAEVFIEAMSRGTTRKRGILAAPTSVLCGGGDCGPSISAYHQRLVDKIQVLKPQREFEVGELAFHAVEARHSDPDTVGVRVETPLGPIGYTSDTGPFEGLGDDYRGVRLLILCTMRPRGRPLQLHLSIDDAIGIVERARPSCVALTHFGMMMLRAGPEAEAMFLERETGVPAVAARDGIQVRIGESIEFSGPAKKDEVRIVES